MLENTLSPSVLSTILTEWGQLYRAEMLERFEVLTRGGSEWPYLRFVRPRNRVAGTVDPRQQNILWDEGFLVGSLQPEIGLAENNGGRQEIHGRSVTIGFAKTIKHKRSRLTVQAIADKHQGGMGVPQRRILVPPSDELIQTMLEWAQEAILNGEVK